MQAKMRSRTVREGTGDRIFSLVNGFILLIVALVTIYPLWFTLIASVSEPNAVSSGQVVFFPKGFTLEYYKYVFGYRDVMIGYRNTLFYTVAGTSLNVLVSLMMAYALAQKKLFGRKLFTGVLLFTMFFNGGLIPTYLIMDKVNLVDQWYTMLFIGLVSAYNVIIARTYIEKSIPGAMLESAEIDGSGDIRTLFSIVVPVSVPMIAVLALYYGSSHWNRYFSAMIYLNDRNKMPLQLFLREILIVGQTVDMMSTDDVQAMKELSDLSRSVQYSLIVVASLPMILLYPFMQKYFVGGIMIGSVKG